MDGEHSLVLPIMFKSGPRANNDELRSHKDLSLTTIHIELVYAGVISYWFNTHVTFAAFAATIDLPSFQIGAHGTLHDRFLS